MMKNARKVCISGPVRLALAQDLLEEAGCKVVLGKNYDDFPKLRYPPQELIDLIGDADALLAAPRDVIDRKVLEQCRNLQAVVKGIIGIETVDLEAATELGILVCNSPAPENFIGLAEATVGLIVALFKRVKLNEAHLRQGGWKEPHNRGDLMMGKTVGIIGIGRVGRETARRLGPWGLRLIAYDPYVSQETVNPLGVKMVSLEELLRRSDIVSLHPVLTPETYRMITLRELSMMKPTAFLVNTSRGAVVREEDLIEALDRGVIAGAALDVFEEEPLPTASRLREIDPSRLILTPHIVGNNPQSLATGQRMAVESLLSILSGKAPETVCNPEAIKRWRTKFWD